ncbi:MFS transporter, partial [Klebsiella pneumoniae]|nr:MFS transporter [Klebsiella pneumoniae]
ASDLIPATRRGEGIGYFGLAATIAMALGPLTGIWLMDKYGFGVLFLITGLSTVLAFALAQFVRMPAPVITAPNIQQSSFVSRFIER